MSKNILIAGFLFMLGSCATTESGNGLQLIENMSDARFNQVTSYIKIATQFGASKLIEANKISVLTLNQIANELQSIASKPVSDNLAEVFSGITSKFVSDDMLLLVLRTIEGEIQARGGLGVIKASDGTLTLSDRSKAIITAVADGIRSATRIHYTGTDPIGDAKTITGYRNNS